MSLPTRERELKLRMRYNQRFPLFVVAPHAGARIETPGFGLQTVPVCVAPHAGARIETCPLLGAPHQGRSLPTRERELKRARQLQRDGEHESLPTRERELKQRAQRPRGGARVAPHAGARIETFSAGLRLRPSGSLPTRERELKHAAPPSVRARDTSLPTRERELKLERCW